MERIEELAQKMLRLVENGRREFERREQLVESAARMLGELEQTLEEGPSGEEVEAFLQGLRRQIDRMQKECGAGSGERIDGLEKVADEIQEEMKQCANLANLGELSASVAHEIRNPLCGMLFSLDVLQTKMDEGDSRMVLLENVRREAEKMEKIVQNLLHFARNYEPRLTPCDIKEVVSSSIDSVQTNLKKKDISVEMRQTTGNTDVAIDRDLMQQVFRNLLMNSVDASPKGRTLVADFLDVNGKLGVAITDKGEGVREEEIKRIFEPFYTSKEKGVGLGLAVSKKIVEAHNGRIEVRSEPGKGTTFTVIIPRNT